MTDHRLAAGEKPVNLDQEVDLFAYLHALVAVKYRIVLIAAICAVAVYAFSKTIEDTFSATAIVAINVTSEPGGVERKNYRAGDSLGLIEYDLLIDPAADNEVQRLLARMKSAAFSELFVSENDLLQYIYEGEWDSSAQNWSEDFKPDLSNAVLYFRKNMRSVELDQVTKLLNIKFVTRDPKLSATLANRFVLRFNKYIQEMEASEISDRRKFLESRLDGTSNLEIQRSIYRMLETQLATEALIFAKKNYPLEPIQPALPPQFKSSPKRKTWAILAFVGSAFAGIVFVLSWVMISKLRKALAAYGQPQDAPGRTLPENQNPVAEKTAKPTQTSRKIANAQADQDSSKTQHPAPPNPRNELDEWLE